MREASEKYGTAVMKDDEVLLFVEACVENGSSIGEAYADMKMIDTLLHAERLHLATGHHIKKTSAGHYRKGSDFYTTMDRVLEGRLNGAFNI